MRIQDVVWYDHLEDAQQVARARRLPIAIKPLGQGTNDADDW
jgi:hypothetical protein